MTQQREKKQLAMLAAQNCTFDDVRFPADVSTKFDGIRCLTVDQSPLSRENLLLPNLFLQRMLSGVHTNNLDGELIIGAEDAEDCYNVTQSGIMKVQGEPAFRYFVFDDLTDPKVAFEDRQKSLQRRFMSTPMPEWCVLVKQRRIENREQLVSLYDWLVENGHEGVITRNALSPYKRGRGTVTANDMIKLKPREDSEFEVMGFEELLRNNNTATVSETGHTKRSSAKAGKTAGGTLGKILARDIYSGIEFKIGTFKGLKAKDKQYIWDHQSEFLRRIGVYTFCPVGVKKLPRHPSFKGWRDSIDISA